MGETRIRRFVAGLAGAVVLTATFVAAAPPGAPQEPGPGIVASLTYADPENPGPPDYIWANGMTPGEAFRLELDFENDGNVDYSKDGFADAGGGWTFDDLGTSGRLLPGSHITLTGTDPEPDWVKDLVVDLARVEFADPFTDGAGGVASPGATVHLSVPLPGGGGPDLVSVDVTADGTGWWHYDLGGAGFDLTTDHTVSARVDDGDGDLSTHGIEARRPVVHATIGAGPGGYVWLYGWPDGMPVTVEVDVEPDGTVDETIHTPAYMFGPGVILSGDNGQLQVGSRITVTADNGAAPFRWQKVLDLEPMGVDDWSIDGDWIGGFAPPERSLRVEVQAEGPPPAAVDTGSDPEGRWVADFTGAWDVHAGTGFIVRLPEADDGDGDSTGIQFMVPAPVVLNAWPTAGLWDGAPVEVFAGGLTPNTFAFVSVNVAANPLVQYQMVGQVPVGDQGFGQTTVNVPRFVGGADCADAPGTCILVVADQPAPFERNATVPLSFGQLDLFRFTPDDPQDPHAGGIVGDPITALDEVGHRELIWVQGTGFAPGGGVELDQCKDFGGFEVCRSTWASRAYTAADDNGTFGVPLEVGRNVLGTWGSEPQLSISPRFDLRDGDTVIVSATGLPPDAWMADCGPGQCWIGARLTGWDQDWSPYRSEPLTFSGEPVPLSLHVSEALVQQLDSIVHILPGVGTEREVSWDRWGGTLTYPYTAVQRWVEPDLAFGPWSPPPVEGDVYDCADALAVDPASGAQEPVHCAISLEVREGTELFDPTFFTWRDLTFARFDLTAAVSTAKLGSRPAGVTLSGEVTCTGFMPERYLVTVEGTLTQTSTKGRRPTTVSGSFTTTIECAGTMSNPGRATWTAFVPGAFKAGSATVTLDVSSAGFTPNDAPLHVETVLTVTAPPKGKG